ncbi:MAG TPA: MBL fold metallo-hydrolase [Bacillus sp. (in: firmicutes)]|uniref:MBL fold metallo-hydrolase n=1 Tax=Bacillus litorisediminis TaxID=2922713 RepID=UPI001FABB2CC|nr:MBL fold metallo-hydrolase [Bacillus litorisediminis]HWO76714.1 MBL fold metallo-hydrolase [Bacillus sp. (in: firmicutes)]
MDKTTASYISSLNIYKTGECFQLGKLTDHTNPWKKQSFPALIFSFYHPQKGNILFDTGYDSAYFSASKKFPYRLYRFVTPVKLCDDFSFKISLPPIDIVLISHFHADHLGGLYFFKDTQKICSKQEWESVRDKKGLKALKRAYLPDLVPPNFPFSFVEDTSLVRLPDELFPFTRGYDLFGDSLVYAVHLPGHTNYQYGVFLKTKRRWVLLCADASWSLRSIEQHSLPLPFARLAIEDWHAYVKTFTKLNQLHSKNKNILIFPSHCEATYLKWKDTLETLD